VCVYVFAVVSMPKKRRKMKDLNKKEAGDLLDAFKEVCRRAQKQPRLCVHSITIAQSKACSLCVWQMRLIPDLTTSILTIYRL